MWEMSGLQLVKYHNILTLILLVLDPTQISPYIIYEPLNMVFYTVKTLNKDITDTGSTYDMEPYVDMLIHWCNWGAGGYI